MADDAVVRKWAVAVGNRPAASTPGSLRAISTPPTLTPVSPRKPSAAGAFARAWNEHFRPSKRQFTIEQALVWAYTAQRVVEITGRAMYAGEQVASETYFAVPHVSGDGCAQIERNAMLGRPIDGGGPIRGISQPLHPDAEALHEAVLSLPWHQAAQLVRFGRTGIHPEPPPEPKLYPVTEWNGRRWRVKTKARYDHDLRCKLTWCPVVMSPDPRDTEVFSEVYEKWRAALKAMRDALYAVPLRSIEVRL